MEARAAKQEIRRAIRARRRHLDAAWVAERSERVQRRVMGLPEFERARCVSCYLEVGQEVQTGRILNRCWSGGREVCVPAFCPQTHAYRFCRLSRGARLAQGPYAGVPEPEIRDWCAPGGIDVAVVPGLAFDAAGRRIGHGGGHYDRLLASLRTGAAERGPGGAERRLEHPPAVGLAFDFQVFDELPSSPDDVAVDVVVTESRTIRCTQQR